MIITNDMLNKKVPADMFPKRLDSALNLYTYIDSKGILLYNINPTTWNILYPYFEQKNKFTLDNYQFSNTNLTFKELILEYQKEYKNKYEKVQGYSKNVRRNILVEGFKKEFNLKEVEIDAELKPVYELKYSKTKNVWTLYYFENYVVKVVQPLKKLITQQKYQQEFLPINYQGTKINNIEIVENMLFILNDKDNIEILEKNKLVIEE